MTTNATSLPNPFTPLAFLPPVLAGQVQAIAYLSVCVLSALSWDWLLTIREEIQMCRNRKFRPAIVVYFLSRMSAVAYCALTVVFYVMPLTDCHGVAVAIESILILVIASTSALFFFRVRAVYYNSKIITIFFGVLWLLLLGFSFLVPLATSATHIGPTQMCILSGMARYVLISIPVILHAAFDTLVFLAISFRIISFSIVGDTFIAHTKSFFRGDGLPNLLKSLLFGGQAYYVVACTFDILLLVMLLAPVSPAYPGMLVLPHVALDSAMACRVFRGITLGSISDNDAVTLKTNSLRFATNAAVSGASSAKIEGNVDRLQHTSDHIVIDITKEIELRNVRGYHAI